MEKQPYKTGAYLYQPSRSSRSAAQLNTVKRAGKQLYLSLCACVCVCELTVDLVVWWQQSDVGEGDAACVAVIKLHCDKIIIVIDI